MNVRPRLCIPVFDNAESVVAVVRGCLAHTALPILVVDDGSKIPVEQLLRADETVLPLLGSHIVIRRFDTNRGKGAAIALAFRDSVADGFTHAVTIDADGQHLPEELPTLLDAMRANPWSLIVGSRDLQGASAPPISKFGRRFSNFWVRFQTDSRVGDSQSGLRIYPLFHVQRMTFRTRRFDFEIEALIRLMWRGVSVVDVPVKVHYPPPSERVTHFDKLWDNARISFLNSILVALTLLKGRLAPVPAGAALAVGTFIGCSPFLGFHSFLAVLAALVLRLNAGLIFAGTCVSTPPLGIAIAAASIHTGHRILGETPPALADISLAAARAWWRSWLVGFMPVALSFAFVAGVLGYLIARSFAKGRKGQWSGKSRGGKLGNALVDQILLRLGHRAGYFCLWFIVPYFVVFAPRGTRASLEFWAVMYPQESRWKRWRRVFAHFYRFGTVLMDRRLQSLADRQVFPADSHGFTNIATPVREGRGLVLASAHVGSWDLASQYMKIDGYEGGFSPVRFDARGDVEAPARKRAQERAKLKPLAANKVEKPIFELHALLMARKPVGLMADRPMSRHFELVPFFGYLAPFDATAFRLAAATGTPVVFSFGFKGKDGRYDFYATEPKNYRYLAGDDRDSKTAVWLGDFSQVLEAFVRKYPDQWFNFYPFWSSVPGKA